jgi:hypothetical protein
MKFSGALRDSSGKPLTGSVDVTFALYSTESGGDALWFETQSVLADELGRYTALLGAMHTDGLPVDLFTSGEVRWLGIRVGVEAEQQPRVLLVSVPYALKAGDAETLGGKPASAYMLADSKGSSASTGVTLLAGGTVQGGTSGANQRNIRTANSLPLTPVCAGVTSNLGGTANYMSMFTAACNIETSNISQSGSNIGIGTATPTYPLDITSPSNASIRLSGPGTHQYTVTGVTSGRLGQDAAGFFFASDTSGSALRFLTNNGTLHEWFRITSAGNVGIATTAPAATLEVNGTAKFDGAVTFAAGQNITGNVSSTGQLISTVTTGTAPLSVTSTTQVANLNASQLGGLSSSAFAKLTGGNSFTGNQIVTGNITGTTFFGSGAGLTSLDAIALFDGLAVQQNATSPNIIGGYVSNSVTSGLVGATISGGGSSGNLNTISGAASFGTIGGGAKNTASGFYSTIGGGSQNTASGSYATVGGGVSNVASGSNASIVGGGTGNTASGLDSTIGGGIGNTTAGSKSTIPGGDSNSTGASADHSFAAGFDAVANHSGTFVWADNVGSGVATPFTSTATNQFLIRASNGVGIGTASPNPNELEVNGGVRLNTSTAQPTCVDATQRGTFWIIQGATGVKDTVQVCAKDATNTYAWRTLF